MKAACGSRPALLGAPVRKQAAATRRQGAASGRLQVQALKIKWNEPSEKPNPSKDETEAPAAGGKATSTTAAAAPPPAAPASQHKAAPKPVTQASAAKPGDAGKAPEAKAAGSGSSAARKGAPSPAAGSVGAPDLAATVKEVAAKLGVIPNSSSPTPAASAAAQQATPSAAAGRDAPSADNKAAPASAAVPSSGGSSNGSRPGAAAAAAASRPAQAPGSGKGAGGGSPRGGAPPPSGPPSTRPEISAVMGAEAKLAVAAKISAARTLARKLAEEKQAALAASRLASARAVDPEAAKQMIQSAENEVAELAREAAKADAMARAAKKAELGQAQQLELQRLKAENETLQQLLLQLAADRQAAEAKLKEVKERYTSPAELDALRKELSTAAAAPAAAPGRPAPAAPAPAGSAVATPAAPPAAAPPPPKPKPSPKPTPSQLQQLAEAAARAGKRVFTVPEGSVPVGRPCTVYYDRSKGPLPGNAAIALKVGYNKWESIEELPMSRAGELSNAGGGAEWWALELPLPDLLFRIDFVTMDSNSGAVDNNGGRDFQLALGEGAISEQELQLKRMQLLEAYEEQRIEELRAEEDRIYTEWMAAAEAAATEARRAYHERRKEQLMQEARAVVSERRGAALQHITTAQEKAGVYGWPDGTPEAGAVSTLVYNRASGPLRGSTSQVFLHIGYDGWWLKDKRVITMSPVDEADARKWNLPAGQWVSAEVPAWNTAALLDYVFSDDRRSIWDNNGGRDYHTLLKNPASGDKLVQLVYEALDTATAADTAHQEDLAARRVLDKQHIKATAGRRRRELQSRYLFTKPLTPVAGQPVDIFYNPDETALRGRPDVFVTGSYNRWTHNERIRPLQMQPVVPGGVGWHKATVQVPKDAHVLDLAFLDSADERGGFYDNNKGLDYHVPVKGGAGAMPQLRVVHVAAEMAPIAKEGGLGDVVTALGRAVQEEGHDVEVVLPKYDCINYNLVQDLKMAKDYWLNGVQVKIWKGYVEGLATTFLEPCNGYFWKGRIYTDIWTDRERFYYWCGCALEYIKHHADARQ